MSFLAVLWALVRIEYPEEKLSRHQSMWESLHGGFAYLRSDPQMWVLIRMTLFASFFGFPFITFIPYFAKVQLNAGERGLGLLLACSGVGSVLGRDDHRHLRRDPASRARADGLRYRLFPGDHRFQLLAPIRLVGVPGVLSRASPES